MSKNGFRTDTIALHGGQEPDGTTLARAVPIYQTTSYVFDDADHAASLFNLQTFGFIYSRLTNPTVAVLQERVAALEHGVGAIATASGHAALHLAVVTLMGQGAHIVSSASLYGGSVNLENAHSLIGEPDIDGLFVGRAAWEVWRSVVTGAPA